MTSPNPPAPATSPLDVRFAAIASLVFAVVLLPRILLHELWRDEWQAWMLAVPATFGELAARIRYEGHPGLWHAMLWAIGKLWPDPVAMKLLHVVLATAAAGVVAAAMPVPGWQRALVVSGYFFSFEYAVVSRNYAVGVLCLALYAAVFVRSPRAYIAQGVCLALAVQANFLATILASACGLVILLRLIADRADLSRRDLARAAAGATLLLLSLAFVAVQVGPREDRAYAEPVQGVEVDRAGKVAASGWRGLAAPVPAISRDWWSANVLDFTLDGPLKATQSALGLVAIAVVTVLTWRTTASRALWLAGAGGQLLFAYVVFPGAVRHAGYLWIAAVLAIWLAGGPGLGWRRATWVFLLISHAFAGLAAGVADLVLPFSAAGETARYLQREHPDAVLIGQHDFAASPIAGGLGRPLYYPVPGRMGTYVQWDRHRSTYWASENFAPTAARLANETGRPVVLVLSAESRTVVADADLADNGGPFELVATFDDSTVPQERYRLYAFRAASPTTQRSAGG